MKSHHDTIGVEILESRRLLAAQIVNGELIATGTDVRDDIELRRTGIDDVLVTIRTGASGTLASQQTFDLDDFNRIRVLGLGGNDYLHVAGNVSLPNLTLDGGNEFGDEDVLQARSGRFVDGERILDNSGHAVVTFDDSPSEHIIHGTPGNDRIAVSRRNGEHFIELNASFAGVVKRTTASEDGFIHMDAGNGNDTIVIRDGVRIVSDGGVEGGEGNDFYDLAPNCSVNVLAGPGDDTVFARGGPENNDLLQISRFELGDGIDTIQMDGQTELKMGLYRVENATNAQGTVFGNELDNRITVRAANTAGATLHGGTGDDTLIGGPGPDKLFGGEEDDTLLGNGGNDLLDGDRDIDFLDGGPGDDTLLNGENNRVPQFFIEDFGPGSRILTALGTLGADAMNVVRTGIDDVRITVNGVVRTFDMDDFDRILLYGGPGNDTLSAGNGVAEVFLRGRGGNDRLTGNELLNRLVGGTGDDALFGNAGNDLLEGGAGNDTLDGGSGNDNLQGEEGDDTLTGGAGDDDMDGGRGNDTFFARDGLGGELVRGGFDFEFIDRAQADSDDVLEGIEEVLP